MKIKFSSSSRPRKAFRVHKTNFSAERVATFLYSRLNYHIWRPPFYFLQELKVHRILKTEMCISISFICYEVFIERGEEKKNRFNIQWTYCSWLVSFSHNNINIILAPMMTRFNRVNCLNIRSSDSWLQGRGGYSADIRVLKVDNLNWSQALKSRQDFPRTRGIIRVWLRWVRFNFVGKWKNVITYLSLSWVSYKCSLLYKY